MILPDAPKVSSKKRVKGMTPEQLEEYAKQEEQRGVLYMSRVPPYMKPQKIRHLLSEYGAVLRIYLTPEDAAVARSRVKSGGSRSKKFLDGWIEFADKRIAKRVALTLNATTIGNASLILPSVVSSVPQVEADGHSIMMTFGISSICLVSNGAISLIRWLLIEPPKKRDCELSFPLRSLLISCGSHYLFCVQTRD